MRLPIPPIVFYFSYVSTTVAVVAFVLMFLPKSVMAKCPKPVRTLRAKFNAWWKRARELSADGPFYKLMVWSGHKLGRGKLASHCRAPDLKAKPSGDRIVQMTVTPRLPWNPWHVEAYMLAWVRQSELDEPTWRMKEFDPLTESEKVEGAPKGKFRFYLEGLPQHTALRVRACGINAHGRGPWSKEIDVCTLAVPTKENGLTGPAGEACGKDATYTWTQTSTEVFLRVPLTSGDTAKNLKVKWTPSRIEVRSGSVTSGSDEILVGPLCKRVKVDEVFWTIEDGDKTFGRHLHFQMVKVEALEKWASAIDAPGHPQIDTEQIQFFTEGEALSSLGDLSALGSSRK